MPSNDLNSYQSPFDHPVVNLPSADFSSILTIVFFLVFVGWAVYSVVAAYHWFRYGHRSWLAIPALAIHIIVSGIFILLMASGV